ncbi:hypothetical protein CJJ23_04480 [Mycoplasmopsis agassizii]|uniref:Aminotransferase class V domain-containing protein n=1 Tax=Mycoplasmopsis agassizii TaxID=33922 RepID=A0A269THN8_9BACT|nr:aminotransferase class V-fold PLP-dependent enzyme [Mycoplasmopsis agassizii]PAK20969.1 hypothetical protein CJJ23_04480 [Mycoplasmopsis agassizii]
MKDIKTHFPMANKIIYFDSAAASLKPISMIEAEFKYYTEYGISTRSADTEIGKFLSAEVNRLRARIKNLVSANEDDQVIIHSGTTFGLNQIAFMINDNLKEGDEIILAQNNHSSNIVPWFKYAENKGVKIIISKNILSDISDKTKVISLSQSSNNFDNEFDFHEVEKITLEKNIILVNDAAQAIVHEEVKLKNNQIIIFSANKFFGPTGLGFSIISKNIFNKIKPKIFGGGATNDILFKKDNKSIDIVLKENIDGYEPGTSNLAGIMAMHGALDFADKFNTLEAKNKIIELSNYFVKELKKIENYKINIYQRRDKFIVLFNIKNYHSQDISSYLASKNLYVRQGKFCSYLSFDNENDESFVRISFGIYNTKSDVDKLIYELKNGGDFFVI